MASGWTEAGEGPAGQVGNTGDAEVLALSGHAVAVLARCLPLPLMALE